MTRRFLKQVAAALGLLVAGVIAGLVVAHVLGPTNGDVRAAARSLVPPGAVITEQSSGYVGGFGKGPGLQGPYEVYIHTSEGGEDHSQRVAAFGRQAEKTGWRLMHMEDREGAAFRRYRREAITAEVSIDRLDLTAFIATSRYQPATLTRQAVGAGAGATSGLVAWVVLRRWRRRGPSWTDGGLSEGSLRA